MRLLVIVPWERRLGGAEAMLQGVLDGVPSSGHEVELVFLKPGPWPEELRTAGFRVDVIEAGRLRQVHRWAATVLRLRRIIRERDPDVILNWSATTQLYGSPAAVLARASGRVVWWQHGIPKRNWLDMCATALPAAAICCYSQSSVRAQQRLFPRRRTFAVAAGSPVPAAAGGEAAPLALPSDVPVVGIVGRLQSWKGQDRLLRAQAILRDRGKRVHLLIVGGDSYGRSPQYAASLAPLAASLGTADDVTMTGEVDDASPYMELMDILINASDQEPFGIVILEGMAKGIAVVAVNSGGPADFVQDGRTGVLARSGEPAALADAIETLLVSSDTRTRIGEAARTRFLEEYTTDAMRRRFFATMEAACQPRPKR